jgi:hypothetical protein
VGGDHADLRRRGLSGYVVTHVANKPPGALLALRHDTWLPFSQKEPLSRHLMILRNMLGQDFPSSVQNCAEGSDQAAIALCQGSMGDFYPEVARCDLETYLQGGATACFDEFQRGG